MRAAQPVADILGSTRSVAVVGVSDDPSRPSNEITRYLLSSTCYEIALVNPRLRRLVGRPVFGSLAELPRVPDLVTVFRQHAALPDVAEEAIAAGVRTLWLQLGLYDEQVARRAEQAGLQVVMDRCIKVEHMRLHRR
ncbi:MAG: CoA-binding protein [Pseudonocardiaceae bacterium]|nr:CoA-binding protein [Pseudonocardiaceae bacterium]